MLRMTINILHLISFSLSQPRRRLRIKARDMFPTALTPHEQTGASAQQVQTRYLSIIIVADNGILDASQITERTRPESFKVSCGTSVHAAHLYAHHPYAIPRLLYGRKKK